MELSARRLRVGVRGLWGILRIYWDNGKENGNYYLGFRVGGLGVLSALSGGLGF